MAESHAELDTELPSMVRLDLCDTGKSHLAQAIGHLVACQGYDVLFATQTQLLNSLRQAVGTYERRFHTLAHVPLLIIDDFGLKPLRSPLGFGDALGEHVPRDDGLNGGELIALPDCLTPYAPFFGVTTAQERPS